MLNFVGEITDPIHKYIRITEVERELIDSHVFQRLRKIRQLAGAHLVYPGAHHTRFEHSLGTMHLTGLAAQSLLDKGYIITNDQIEILRLAALLHDIGHGPFSHLFEEVLLVKNTHTTSHENTGKKIIRETIIHDILAKHGYDSGYIAAISFGESPVIFHNELISGALSSDIMDYLPRDSFFTGVEYGKIDYYRLISSLEVLSNGHLGINKSAINSLESMLISRYQMFKAVYFHKTVRSVEVMLLHSLLEADSQMHFSSLSLDDFIGYTDENIIDAICSLKSGSAVKLARDYKHRQLLKCVYEKFLQNKNKTENIDLTKKQILLKKIIKSLDIQDDLIFIDVSRTPSMPLTPTKHELNSIMLVDKDSEFETPISEIPLIDSISGFLDMIRVYATDVNRDKLEKALKNIDLLPDY